MVFYDILWYFTSNNEGCGMEMGSAHQQRCRSFGSHGNSGVVAEAGKYSTIPSGKRRFYGRVRQGLYQLGSQCCWQCDLWTHMVG